MRIISGSLGGRQLRSLPGGDTRPAMAKAREALFSMLEARGLAWEETSVLDLYAGTGSLAFECLSRDALAAVAVDNGREACRCLAANAENLAVTGRFHIICADVLKYLRRGSPAQFQLVFIDPPYRRDFISPALAALTRRPWLAAGAYVCAEVERGAKMAVPPVLEPLAERLLGQTWLRIFIHNANSDGNVHEDSPLPGDI